MWPELKRPVSKRRQNDATTCSPPPHPPPTPTPLLPFLSHLASRISHLASRISPAHRRRCFARGLSRINTVSPSPAHTQQCALCLWRLMRLLPPPNPALKTAWTGARIWGALCATNGTAGHHHTTANHTTPKQPPKQHNRQNLHTHNFRPPPTFRTLAHA